MPLGSALLANYLVAAFTGATVVAMGVIHWLTRRDARRERSQRIEVKRLYGELLDELTTSLLTNAPEEAYEDWWTRTARLTDAALGRAEEHWVMQPIPGGLAVSDTEEKRLALLKAMQLRLQELIVRLDSMPISNVFDPRAWRDGPDHKPPSF